MYPSGMLKKITAATLVLSILYSQLLWAADVRQMILEAKVMFEDDDMRRAGLAAASTPVAQAVEHQQDLQDLQENNNFSLTTANGDILEYVGQTLKQIKRTDGSILKNVQLDAEGNIVAA